MSDPTPLVERRCQACRGGLPRLSPDALALGLRQLSGWSVGQQGTRLARTFTFRDFAAAMSFVVALAAVAEREDHHPDFAVHWNTVEVTLWTHDAGGLTENDLVLAALVSARPEAQAAPAE